MTINTVVCNVFIEKAITSLVIDVRSPSEFAKGHIPGAVNIPVFDDDERAEIGTLYKNRGRTLSVLHGLELIGPRLKNVLSQVLELKEKNQSDEILIHCHRGGLRSQSFAWLVDLTGLNVTLLNSGYKAFRNHTLDLFKRQYKIILLSGETGCGKTSILGELKKAGEQVVDLEKLANHRGSVFGSIGKGNQPTAQQFENNLANELNKMDVDKRIWLENESPVLGKLHLPNDLVTQMRNAGMVQISTPMHDREKRILNEYNGIDLSEMSALILKLKKYLGGINCNKAIEGLSNGNLHDTVSILLNYYDKTYAHYRKKYNKSATLCLNFEYDNPVENAAIIIEQANSNEL